jgi:hypothetical protein
MSGVTFKETETVQKGNASFSKSQTFKCQDLNLRLLKPSCGLARTSLYSIFVSSLTCYLTLLISSVAWLADPLCPFLSRCDPCRMQSSVWNLWDAFLFPAGSLFYSVHLVQPYVTVCYDKPRKFASYECVGVGWGGKWVGTIIFKELKSQN